MAILLQFPFLLGDGRARWPQPSTSRPFTRMVAC